MLDVSGSMGSFLNNQSDVKKESKMAAARDTLIKMLEVINPDDYFSILTFHTNYSVLLPLTQFSEIDKP